MTKYLFVSLLSLALTCVAHAASGGYTNACSVTTATPGSLITWSSTYAQPIKVTPAPGTTWFLTQSSIIIPANGMVAFGVPTNAEPGTYVLRLVFDTEDGGPPCVGQIGGDTGGGKIIIQN